MRICYTQPLELYAVARESVFSQILFENKNYRFIELQNIAGFKRRWLLLEKNNSFKKSMVLVSMFFLLLLVFTQKMSLQCKPNESATKMS